MGVFRTPRQWRCAFPRERSRAPVCEWPGRGTQERTARRRAIFTSPYAWIEVPTIDGRAQLKIPQGTKNGQKFRMREKGVQNSRTAARGDQIVEIVIQAPEVHDERTKELLREYATLNPADPRAEIWSKV
jgi:hypothetical protein